VAEPWLCWLAWSALPGLRFPAAIAFSRLEDVIIYFPAQQRHADLLIGGVGEVDWIMALPDGESIAGIHVPSGVIVLADMLIDI